LVGAVAISALPPLNGFVSEWLTYQALLQGFSSTDRLIRLMFPIAGAMLALTGALAAACFVKAFGITFLAQARGEHARQAREAPASMVGGQAILAAVCLVLGLWPGLFLKLLDPAIERLSGAALSSKLTLASGFTLGSVAPAGGSVSTLAIAVAGVVLLSVPLALRLVLSRRATVRIGPTWDCGLRGLSPQMQYSATGFSKPIRMIFRALFRPRREVQREYDYSPYFAKTIRFESQVEEVFERRFYRPLHGLMLRGSRRMRALQAGSIQAYLAYVFVTLVILLWVSL
jgi:hydrogenase-4 component B